MSRDKKITSPQHNKVQELMQPHGQFLVYPTEDGRTKIEVRLENETVWLTQQHIADLFQTSKQNIGQHLKKIFEEGELLENSVVKNFFTTASGGDFKKAIQQLPPPKKKRGEK